MWKTVQKIGANFLRWPHQQDIFRILLMKKTAWDCLNGYLCCLSVLTLSEGGEDGEDLVLWEGGLFQGAQRVISPPPPAGRGASAHCPAGVVNLRQNGERNGMWHCRVSIQYPTGPNRQAATKPPTHPRSKGSGSTPDLGHSGLGCRGQWRRCLAGVTKVSVKQSAVNCVIHWRHWLFITSTINTTVCCWSNLTADAYTGVLPDSFFLLPVHDYVTFKQWGIWTCAGIKKANAHLPWWPVR